jgi:hypothetical protein
MKFTYFILCTFLIVICTFSVLWFDIWWWDIWGSKWSDTIVDKWSWSATNKTKPNNTKPKTIEYSQELRNAIKWLYDNWLTKFNEPEKFRPYDNITRQQAAKFFSVLAESKYWYKYNTEINGCYFNDSKEFDNTLSDFVNMSCKLGLFKGVKGNFEPNRNMSNAEAVTVMTRLLTNIKDWWWENWYKPYFDYTLEKWLTSKLWLWNIKTVYGNATRWEIAIMIYRAISAWIYKDLVCTSPWWTKVQNWLFITAYKSSTEKFDSKCVSEKRYCINGLLNWSFTNQMCNNLAPKTCSLPRWWTIEHGQSVDSYAAQQVAFGKTCSKSTRTCNNGNLGWSNSSQYASCKVESPKTCKTPWWEDVYHGNTVKWYKKQTISYSSSDTCEANSASATCNNGNFDMSTSYQFSQCSKDSAKSCDLPWWGSIQHGSSVSAFMQTWVNFGQICSTSIIRLCDNGSLWWDTRYEYQTCLVKDASVCVTPWWSTVAHNSSVSAYNQQSVAYGQVCNSPQTKSCLNGVLSFSQGYVYSWCIVTEAARCTTPWWSSIAHWTTVNAYSQSSVAYGNTCSTPQTKTCNNGVLWFSSSYKFESCVVNPPLQCKTPWWSFVEHGTEVKSYSQSSVAYGNTCSTPQTKTCNNWALLFTFQYIYEKCIILEPLTCKIWNWIIAHWETVQAFNSQYASTSTNTCTASISRTCNNGVLSGLSSYIHQYCYIWCTTPWNSKLQHWSSITAYESSVSSTWSSCILENRICNNWALWWSFTFQTCN